MLTLRCSHRITRELLQRTSPARQRGFLFAQSSSTAAVFADDGLSLNHRCGRARPQRLTLIPLPRKACPERDMMADSSATRIDGVHAARHCPVLLRGATSALLTKEQGFFDYAELAPDRFKDFWRDYPARAANAN
jgi:hypothetical protein